MVTGMFCEVRKRKKCRSSSLLRVMLEKVMASLSLNPMIPQLTFVSLLGGGGTTIMDSICSIMEGGNVTPPRFDKTPVY